MLSVSYIYIPGKLGLFLLLLCSLMCAYNQVHYGLMVVLVHLHITLPRYHHYADVSEIIKHLSGTFSIIFHAIYGVVCTQLTHVSFMIVRICVLYFIIIIKSEV